MRNEPYKSSFFRTMVLILGLSFFLSSPIDDVRSQEVVVPADYRLPRRVRWATYDPYYAVTSRIYAQADLIRAQGEAAENYAVARKLHAEAYDKELDNWVKEVRAYWDRRIAAEQKKLELGHVKQIKRMKYLNDKKWKNSRVWDRLKNHTELSSGQIRSGSALNFLLARLAASYLPYEFDLDSSQFDQAALGELSLDPAWFRHLRLKQGAYVFTADQPVQKQINLWPYILRWKEFDVSRKAFETARAEAVSESESTGSVSVDSIKKMQDSLMDLTNRLHGSKTVKDWVEANRRFLQFGRSDRFLRELDREIVRLEKTGDIRPHGGQNGFDPESDGNHVIGLLCYMNRNGIEFAPPEPGNEFAYHNLFVLMRAIYLTVAESDASIQPLDLGELAK